MKKKVTINILGQRFGKLVVVAPAPSRDGNACWRVLCDCGQEHETQGRVLRQGRARSCGCNKRRDRPLKRMPEYSSWRAMRGRCYLRSYQDFHHYGGRGIQVCDRWRDSFAAFLADMGERPSLAYSLDRIDVNGNYEPSNCRWATAKVQAANQRRRRPRPVPGLLEWL